MFTAITKVVNSYKEDLFESINTEQILIQRQTINVKVSGVIFTREITENRPYYVINFDNNGSTDSVTSGESGKTIWISHDVNIDEIDYIWRKLVLSIKEIQSILEGMVLEILMYIVKHNESWDEATIGYWCEFSRNPDVYHAEFWRLLQTPYYLKNYNTNKANDKELVEITELSNIAEVLEKLGETADKIMGRYGLYCIACSKAINENIKLACDVHGINEVSKDRMINELNVHLNLLQKV